MKLRVVYINGEGGRRVSLVNCELKLKGKNLAAIFRTEESFQPKPSYKSHGPAFNHIHIYPKVLLCPPL